MTKNIKLLIVLVVIIGISLIAGSAYLLWQEAQNDTANQSSEVVPEPTEQEQQSSTSQEAAIREAEEYQPDPDEMCTMALVDAVHTETGAEYTFPNGCLAPGWEPR